MGIKRDKFYYMECDVCGTGLSIDGDSTLVEKYKDMILDVARDCEWLVINENDVLCNECREKNV